MKTHTIDVGPDMKLVETVNRYESEGWAVRQIVPSTGYGHAYVVFERSDDPDDYALVPAMLPLRTYHSPATAPAVPVPVGTGARG